MHPYIKAAKDLYTEDELQRLYDIELEMKNIVEEWAIRTSIKLVDDYIFESIRLYGGNI